MIRTMSPIVKLLSFRVVSVFQIVEILKMNFHFKHFFISAHSALFDHKTRRIHQRLSFFAVNEKILDFVRSSR
jgi:hypothetical protein